MGMQMVYPEKIKKVTAHIGPCHSNPSSELSYNQKEIKIKTPWRDNWKYCILSIIHELIEYALILHFEIPVSEIEDFKRRHPFEDIGEMPPSPTYEAHRIADNIEKQLAVIMEVDWLDKNAMRD
jgi:hypothetical protein